MLRFLSLLFSVIVFAALVGCRGSNVAPEAAVITVPPTVAPLLELSERPTQVRPGAATGEQTEPDETIENVEYDGLFVQVDTSRDVHPISPYIYGLSGGEGNVVEEIKPTLMSWGGNPATRFNWRIGHAWNAARDWFYRNGNYGITSGSASDDFISGADEIGAEVRLTVPTLGWVAKNDDLDTCSFPDENGECTDGQQAKCDNPITPTDPERTSVRSTPEDIVDWIEHLQAENLDVKFIAMDNEPELWGFTHYDVNPECPTYREILDKYLAYASAIREVAPDAELAGPVTCCWYYYWNSAAGLEDPDGRNLFIPWFLEQVREYDQENGVRTLDVLDIHYYPEGVYNGEVDEETSSLRLRSTRTLWDENYVAESWIGEPIRLIPLMKELINRFYPGTKLGISEWNWGADHTVNGALAIADVLGIFGREDLYLAAYWRAPGPDTPGMYAFRMYTNYDSNGSRFGDTSVLARSNDITTVSSYGALDSETGNLHIMLINKLPTASANVRVDIKDFDPAPEAEQFRYAASHEDRIVATSLEVNSNQFTVTLPPYSIVLLVISPAENG